MFADVVVDLCTRRRLSRVLTTGSSQNEVLSIELTAALARSGQDAMTHHAAPTNDGSIALRQIAVASTVSKTS